MSIRRLSILFAIALTVILPSRPVNAQHARAIPPNDDFINASAIVPGKAYSVPDIGAATNQVGEPTASCHGNSVISNSIWFSIEMPEGSRIYVSTFGSVLQDGVEAQTTDTVLAVYQLTGAATFTERACNDDSTSGLSSQLDFFASGGVTYYIAAGSFYDVDYLPSSTLQLFTRVLTTSITHENGHFENPIDTGWTLKNSDDDQIVCSNPTYPAVDGSCAFLFRGSPDRVTTLLQTVPFPSEFVARKNAIVSTQFYFRVHDTQSLGSAKVRLIVTYKDNTRQIATLNLSGATAGSHQLQRVLLILKNGKVATLKFEVKFGAAGGALLIDNAFRHSYSADPAIRASALLPVPVAPAAK